MGLFDMIFGGNKGSKNAAKQRLRFVLMQDKLDIPQQDMEKIKDELLAVLSKYVDIDSNCVDICLEKVDGSMAIVANIPVKGKSVN